MQPDGKILLSGYFNAVAGTPRGKLARLLPDGSLDTGFVPPAFPADESTVVWKVVPLADGKILICGGFATVNSMANPGVARLNANGSIDPGFQASGFQPSGAFIRGLAVQSDGRIVLGGRFASALGAVPLVRLNADGSLESAFNPLPAIPIPLARDVAIQPDGRVIAAVNHSIYRFTGNGSIDASFSPPVARDTTFVGTGDNISGVTSSTVSLQPDGRILFGGNFTDVDGPNGDPLDGSHFGVARLNADGTLDPSLTTTHKTAVEARPSSFSRLADGSTLAGFDQPFQKIAPSTPFNLK